MKNIGIILAGGIGDRFQNPIPKQFVEINGKKLIDYTIKTMEESKLIDKIIVVGDYITFNHFTVAGGRTRKESCYNALKNIYTYIPECEKVIITEACRPCITKETINRSIRMLDLFNAVITVSKSINTSAISKNVGIDEILDRTHQYDLLMPECFNFQMIYEAIRKIKKDTTSIIEIFKLMYPEEKIGMFPISLWEGIKLTYPEDYKIVELLLKEKR